MCMLSSYFYAYSAAFGFTDSDENNENSSGMAIIDDIFFVIFTLDILINALTEYIPIGES